MHSPTTDSPTPSVTSFYDLDLHDDVLDALWDMHFDKCTPIQQYCIPPLLQGRDLMGIAQTGTGKTAAYLLPLLTLLQREPHPEDAVNCLIMAPTRELARQIDQALQGFAYYLNINSVAVYGGNDGIRYEQERRSLTGGADIVIATPGRLITHLNLGTLDLSKTTHLVLDEADRMLDMGFSDDIMKIVAHLPKERQTILFSATMPAKIETLAQQIMTDPVEVRIAVSKPAEKITQHVYLCAEMHKTELVKHLFEEMQPSRTILFASSKQKVKQLHLLLIKHKFKVAAMHSDLSQPERDKTMQAFKAAQIDILVATDIVARGIDIDNITLVVNYDTPRDPEDYVHRIGRTARAGRSGSSITLVSENDLRALSAIEKLMGEKINRATLPTGIAPIANTGKTSDVRRNKKQQGAKVRNKKVHQNGVNTTDGAKAIGHDKTVNGENIQQQPAHKKRKKRKPKAVAEKTNEQKAAEFTKTKEI